MVLVGVGELGNERLAAAASQVHDNLNSKAKSWFWLELVGVSVFGNEQLAAAARHEHDNLNSEAKCWCWLLLVGVGGCWLVLVS